MKNILTIFKKELDRVFKDKRLIITLFILPGLFIFLVYSFIGNTIQERESGSEYFVAIVNNTIAFKSIYENAEKTRIENQWIADERNYTQTELDEAYESLIHIEEIPITEIDQYKEKIDNQEWNLLIDIPEDINDYTGGEDHPSVLFYTNPKDPSSATNRFTQYLYLYDEALKDELYGNTDYIFYNYQQSPITEEEMIGTLMSSLLPMLVIMLLFSGAMSIGPESIAGEKERNTISTLLITPIKRSQLAIGKISSLSVLALISAVSSFIGISLSLPKLMNLDSGSLSVFGIGQYALILVVLFSTIFVIIGIVSLISAYSRTIKEATTFLVPIYILTVLVSISTMFSNGSSDNPLVYMIPIYNAVQCLVGIMTFTEGIGVFVLITAMSNTLYLLVFIFILNRMFQSEQIMFKK